MEEKEQMKGKQSCNEARVNDKGCMGVIAVLSARVCVHPRACPCALNKQACINVGC